MERHLAAILMADVVGFSRLMGEDETGTLIAVKGLWKEQVGPKVAEHHGRIVKLMGDGALAMTSSEEARVTTRSFRTSANRVPT